MQQNFLFPFHFMADHLKIDIKQNEWMYLHLDTEQIMHGSVHSIPFCFMYVRTSIVFASIYSPANVIDKYV